MVPNNLQKIYTETRLVGETETEDCKIPSYVEHTHERQGQVV